MSDTEKKDYGTLKVEAIRNGSVIDHIPAGRALQILRHFKILRQAATEQIPITVGLNLSSNRSGTKDIIKIGDYFLDQKQVNQLAFLAPGSTINIIKDYKVVEKLRPSLPERVTGVFACPNANCITNRENTVDTCLTVYESKGEVMMKCHYCEKAFSQDIVCKNLK